MKSGRRENEGRGKAEGWRREEDEKEKEEDEEEEDGGEGRKKRWRRREEASILTLFFPLTVHFSTSFVFQVSF